MINLETQYSGKITPSSPQYPYGEPRNISTPGDGTGTPWEAAWVKDMAGQQQSVLVEAGVVPSGNPDTAEDSHASSQFLLAIKKISTGSVDFINDLIGVTGLDGIQVLTTDRTVTGDQAGGPFSWDSSADKSTADGGITIDPDKSLVLQGTGAGLGCWIRSFNGGIQPRWYGLTTIESLRLLLASLDPFDSVKEYGGLDLINNPQDTDSILNIAHFAGQGTAALTPIAMIVHNYTDAPLAQYDNVGTSEILILKNARNAGRRPDEGPAFKGTGAFLRLEDADEGRMFFITKDGQFIWNDRGVELITDLTPGAGYPFTFDADGLHTLIAQFKNNGSRFLNIQESGSNAIIQSETAGGLILSSSGTTLIKLQTDVGGSVVLDKCGVVQTLTDSMVLQSATTLNTLKTATGGAVVIDTGPISYIAAKTGNLKLEAVAGSIIDNNSPLGLRRYTNIAAAPTIGAAERAIAWSDADAAMITWNGTVWSV